MLPMYGSRMVTLVRDDGPCSDTLLLRSTFRVEGRLEHELEQLPKQHFINQPLHTAVTADDVAGVLF